MGVGVLTWEEGGVVVDVGVVGLSRIGVGRDLNGVVDRDDWLSSVGYVSGDRVAIVIIFSL